MQQRQAPALPLGPDALTDFSVVPQTYGIPLGRHTDYLGTLIQRLAGFYAASQAPMVAQTHTCGQRSSAGRQRSRCHARPAIDADPRSTAWLHRLHGASPDQTLPIDRAATERAAVGIRPGPGVAHSAPRMLHHRQHGPRASATGYFRWTDHALRLLRDVRSLQSSCPNFPSREQNPSLATKIRAGVLTPCHWAWESGYSAGFRHRRGHVPAETSLTPGSSAGCIPPAPEGTSRRGRGGEN